MKKFVSAKRDLFYFSTKQIRKCGSNDPIFESIPIKITIRKQDLDDGYTIALRNFYNDDIIEMIQTRSLENDTSAKTEFYGFANSRQGVIFWDSVLSIGLAYTNQSGVYIIFNLFNDFGKDYLESSEENLLSYLTQREEEVLELLTQGVTYKGVAAKLFISETTVKTHVNNIFQKLQVNDRTQAVLYAINNGFTNKKKALMSKI